jgi:type III restriction enzyme
MPNPFFGHPILNSPYVCPTRHWELDEQGQPTQQSPHFIVLVDDGHGDDDLLHIIGDIKGYRHEDAKEKKSTMETYWVPGVNNLKTFGRWSFAEFTEMYGNDADFKAKVEAEFNKMIAGATG